MFNATVSRSHIHVNIFLRNGVGRGALPHGNYGVYVTLT